MKDVKQTFGSSVHVLRDVWLLCTRADGRVVVSQAVCGLHHKKRGTTNLEQLPDPHTGQVALPLNLISDNVLIKWFF